ncbi:hypothetical protein ACA910_013057 [Epithemia clementina (nom. ined.)]
MSTWSEPLAGEEASSHGSQEPGEQQQQQQQQQKQQQPHDTAMDDWQFDLAELWHSMDMARTRRDSSETPNSIGGVSGSGWWLAATSSSEERSQYAEEEDEQPQPHESKAVTGGVVGNNNNVWEELAELRLEIAMASRSRRRDSGTKSIGSGSWWLAAGSSSREERSHYSDEKQPQESNAPTVGNVWEELAELRLEIAMAKRRRRDSESESMLLTENLAAAAGEDYSHCSKQQVQQQPSTTNGDWNLDLAELLHSMDMARTRRDSETPSIGSKSWWGEESAQCCAEEEQQRPNSKAAAGNVWEELAELQCEIAMMSRRRRSDSESGSEERSQCSEEEEKQLQPQQNAATQVDLHPDLDELQRDIALARRRNSESRSCTGSESCAAHSSEDCSLFLEDEQQPQCQATMDNDRHQDLADLERAITMARRRDPNRVTTRKAKWTSISVECSNNQQKENDDDVYYWYSSMEGSAVYNGTMRNSQVGLSRRLSENTKNKREEKSGLLHLYCPVCMEHIPESTAIFFSCSVSKSNSTSKEDHDRPLGLERPKQKAHFLCLDCAAGHVMANKDRPPIQCFAPGCHHELLPQEIALALGHGDVEKGFRHDIYRELDEIQRDHAIYQASQTLISCPTPNCPWAVARNRDDCSIEKVTCPTCQISFCSNCKEMYHYRTTCQELQWIKRDWYDCIVANDSGLVVNDDDDTHPRRLLHKKWKSRCKARMKARRAATKAERERLRYVQHVEAMDEHYKATHCRHCPHCNRLVERIDGCSIMYCGLDTDNKKQNLQAGCKKKFDWNTAQPYEPVTVGQNIQLGAIRDGGQHSYYPMDGSCDFCGTSKGGKFWLECVHCPCFVICEKCVMYALDHSLQQYGDDRQHVFAVKPRRPTRRNRIRQDDGPVNGWVRRLLRPLFVARRKRHTR